jgi:hypothetical protein
MEEKEAVHYLKLLQKESSCYQIEIRDAINFAIEHLGQKIVHRCEFHPDSFGGMCGTETKYLFSPLGSSSFPICLNCLTKAITTNFVDIGIKSATITEIKDE